MCDLPVPSLWFDLTYAWTGLCFMILLFITLFHTCQQYCPFIDHQETYVFKFLTLFTILSCLVCSSLDIVHITIHFIECSFFQSKLESIIAGFADITYFIASISFYSLLIVKIWFVFKESNFRISYVTLFILFLSLSTIIFFAVWHIISTAFQLNKTDYNPKSRAATDALSICDFVLNVSLFTLFYYKLRQIIISLECDAVLVKYDPARRLLHVISKHSILFGIAMITNQCFYIGIILEEHFNVETNYTKAILIVFSGRAFENLCNALVVWLMLKINLRVYLKICGCCHIKVVSCCKYCIQTKRNDKYIITSKKSINYVSSNNKQTNKDTEIDVKNKILPH